MSLSNYHISGLKTYNNIPHTTQMTHHISQITEKTPRFSPPPDDILPSQTFQVSGNPALLCSGCLSIRWWGSWSRKPAIRQWVIMPNLMAWQETVWLSIVNIENLPLSPSPPGWGHSTPNFCLNIGVTRHAKFCSHITNGVTIWTGMHIDCFHCTLKTFLFEQYSGYPAH